METEWPGTVVTCGSNCALEGWWLCLDELLAVVRLQSHDFVLLLDLHSGHMPIHAKRIQCSLQRRRGGGNTVAKYKVHGALGKLSAPPSRRVLKLYPCRFHMVVTSVVVTNKIHKQSRLASLHHNRHTWWQFRVGIILLDPSTALSSARDLTYDSSTPTPPVNYAQLAKKYKQDSALTIASILPSWSATRKTPAARRPSASTPKTQSEEGHHDRRGMGVMEIRTALPGKPQLHLGGQSPSSRPPAGI